MDEVYWLKMTDHEGRRPRMVKVDPRAMTNRRTTPNTLAVAMTHKVCSVCGRLVETDPRGDVLDASGRCLDCQP